MADDPRIDGAVARLMLTHPSWFKRLTTVRNRNPEDPGHADALYTARTIAEAAVKGADAEDRLRRLLADEDGAEQLLRRAIADPGQFLRRAGWGTSDAETITSWSARAVLAALRKVAGP